MHIKRFEAATIAEAVQQVREELGPEAVILSKKTVRGRRFGLFGRSVVEVTAAVERQTVDEDRPTVAADPSWRGLQLSRALVEPLEDELRSVRRGVELLQAAGAERSSIAEELSELRRLARELRADRPHTRELEEVGRLLSARLAPHHAWSIASEARGHSGRPEPVPDETLADALARRLDARIGIPREDDLGPMMFVGSAGVGKTCSLAKLAARMPDAGRRLALVSADSHRHGAELLLRRFSRELEVPFDVAFSPEQLAERTSRLARPQVLVDTAGSSRSDPSSIGDLLRLRNALGQSARVQLVLSATTKEADLRAEIERHAPLEPEGVVVTKADESGDLSNVVNVLLDDGPPLLWIANGQRVPEDLVVPDGRALAGSVLGEAA